MFNEFPIVEVASVLAMFVINYLKYRSDNIRARKQNKEEHDKLFKDIGVLSDTVKDINTSSRTEDSLFNDITQAGVTVIHSNADLEPKIIRLMNKTISEIRDFAVMYNKSAYRKTKKDITEFMDIEIKSIRGEIHDLSDELFPLDGCNTEKYSDFSEDNSSITRMINNLVDKLIANGLDKSDYNALFVEFTKEIAISQTKVWREWIKCKE